MIMIIIIISSSSSSSATWDARVVKTLLRCAGFVGSSRSSLIYQRQ